MAQCSRCGSETEMYVSERPLCIRCADKIDEEIAELVAQQKPLNARAGELI
jgi:hypothetical protein